MEEPRPPGKPTLIQEIGSVLASFFGVQSSRNRERDFTRGSAGRFVILGIAMTLAFVLTVVLVVRIIVSQVK